MVQNEKESPSLDAGHLKGYYREGGKRAWSFIIDTYGPPSPQDADDLPAPRSDGCSTKSSTKDKQLSDMELMRERFAKLLLGEDMSGGGKGVSSALAISNAVTNLAASVFGKQKRLEPMLDETKERWRKEMDWLLAVTDHIVEFVPSRQRLNNGGIVEVMATRQRHDLHINIPALHKLDTMLLDCLDNFKDINEFHYALENDDDSHQGMMTPRHDDKWWIPTPKVPPNGLSSPTRKWFMQQKDSVNQVLKAAMAINSQVLSEMEIPESYIESLPKNGRTSLGDTLYKIIMDESFDADYFLSHADLSSEHKIVELENKLEASVVIWKRKLNAKDSKSSWGSTVSLEKRGIIEERAETVLTLLKHRFPGLPQSDLDIFKIQYNRDVGLAILESYSRVIEGLAFTVMSRIEDVMHADWLARAVQLEQRKHSFKDSPLVKTTLDKSQDIKDKDSGMQTPTSMTLLDFMGWSLDSGEKEIEMKKDDQDEIKKKQQLNRPPSMNRSKKISYMEKVENSSGLRSPTPRD